MNAEMPIPSRFGGRFADWLRLAEGAEGRLYRVTDRWTGRVAALKVGDVDSAGEALRREFRLLSRYHHPCLIESRDLIHEDAEIGHLLEYVPAVDPRSLWEVGGEAAVWAALTQALRGLAYLHRHGIVHGDVAPGNILVWPEGDRWRAKVADFGLAQGAKEAAASAPRGTTGYMAPENARGEGFGPAADLYSLAAATVAWIDSIGPWDRLSPGEALRRAAAGADVPGPRRRVSAELAALIAALGRGTPEDRGPGDWAELRARQDAWGPPVRRPGVFGLDEPLQEWATWLDSLPAGRVGAISLRGRLGSGRGTAGGFLARRMVAEGWTALWDLPLEGVRDWLEEAEGDPDPVRLARELGRRFEDKDIVVLWPERTGDLESRLLRALVVGREQEGSARRTCVVKVTALVDPDADAEWLESAVRVLRVDWRGPAEAGLRAIRDDLFSPDEGFETEASRPTVDPGSSPLAVVRLKHRRLEGDEEAGPDEGEEAVRREVARVWAGAEAAVRGALTIFAWSDRGWSLPSLGTVLGWSAGQAEAAARSLEGLGLTRRDYDRGALQERITDWLVRAAVREQGETPFGREAAETMSATLDAHHELHPDDLGLVGLLLAHGFMPPAYTRRALEAAIKRGRYESILRLWEQVRELWGPSPGEAGFLWEAALRATQRLGKFHEEVAILRAFLTEDPKAVATVERRKMLSHALFAASDAQGAVAECDAIIAACGNSNADGLWARVQKAEFLWQISRFDDARAVYDAVGDELGDDDELFLKYAIGRARMSGQVGDFGSMARYIGLIERDVPSDISDSKPLYLHVRTGLGIKNGEQLLVEPLIRRAVELTEKGGQWKDYVMISSRAGAVAFDLGKVRQAHRLGTAALSTALAQKSDWMAIMAALYLGYYEVYLGDYQTAQWRYESALKLAGRLDDNTLKIQGNRLKAFVSAHAGDRDRLTEAQAFLCADKGNLQATVLSTECEGHYRFGQQDWEQSKHAYEKALVGLERSQENDEAAIVRARLAYVAHKLDDQDCAQRHFGDAWAFFQTGKFPRMRPIARIVGVVVHGSNERYGLGEAVEELREQSRATDLAYWGIEILSAMQGPAMVRARRDVLEAVRTISESYQDLEARRRFLGVPRIKEVLHAIQSRSS